ncbi:MAG: EAL domain-containing protein [Clostridia bacterium]|nr:EAL domain-containing protein [Clostridia bacterium]MDD4145936.1 EAL domain-containing protein [Clostridia bacterium]MDD4665788.1 EAL domain-containing protein [Clostridia bacterium]
MFFKCHHCYQAFLVGITIFLCSIMSLYYSLYLKAYFFYGGIFYLPITLAGFWCGKKAGLVSALFFSGLIILNSTVSSSEYLFNNLLQIMIFVLVGYVVGALKEKDWYSEKIIEHQAYHDLLTGLPNRLSFEESLEKELVFAQAQNQLLAVYLIDLDRFKYINDILGHLAGDKLLVQVSKRLIDALAEDAVIARSSGDEFLVFVPGVSEEQAIIEIAMKIIDSFKKKFIIHEREVYITISVGISVFPAHGKDSKSLISHTDMAMNKAKEMGMNGYRFFSTEMNRDISDKLYIANNMRQMVEEKKYDAFELHYQPMVEVGSGRIVGVEALLRWHHPDEGLLYPERFIEVAEETRLIVPIGKWVLQTACVQIKKWQKKSYTSLKLSVNISEQQLRDKAFLNDVLTVLTETRFDPSCLELEITETVAMNNFGRNIEVLGELRRIGIRIALDDFGSGYSSLNYLGTLPINILKVDYNLVKEIPFNIKKSAIATSIISLATCLNYEVVAEGVETEAQLVFFQQQRCTYIQGYFFSKPLPPKELEALLEEQQKEVAFVGN